MNTLNELNPAVAFLWLMVTAGIAMFCFSPVILALSVVGALFYFLLRNPDTRPADHVPYFILFIASAIANPLFSHNGATVLFVMNHNPITLESLLYGVAMGAMIMAVLYWFRSFQQIMTSDKLLYVFGSAVPKLTLILSIALRYLPMLRRQTRKIRDAQRGIGLFKDENLFDRLRGEMRIFSVLVTWALENGIITADSMAARGYGLDKRSRFALFRFAARDCAALLICMLLSGSVVAAIACGKISASYYPRFTVPDTDLVTMIAYTAYGILAFMPGIMEVEERIRWKFLESKI